MTNPETTLMHKIMHALSERGCLVFRNNTGLAWQGQKIHEQAGVVTLKNPRMIRFGLCVGSADIIGVRSDGKFLAIEVKIGKGRQTKEQAAFIEAVRASGGVAGVVRSVEESLSLISEE
jgi:hypothetical protein